MNELILRNVNFNFIPKPAQAEFYTYFMNWYDDTVYYDQIPVVNEDMIFADPLAKQYLLDFFTDVTDYVYVHESQSERDSSMFPVEKSHWPDYVWENCQQAYLETADQLEVAFVLDIKRFMDFHHICYRDDLNWKRVNGNFNGIHNSPVVAVW
ncbi:hypothetical protein ACQKJG_18775 [Priestia megaterium]|uniref:hypothetical protein n=1 Tax=Priestia megaterium TaxID=1404 RepID=UPI003D005E83